MYFNHPKYEPDLSTYTRDKGGVEILTVFGPPCTYCKYISLCIVLIHAKLNLNGKARAVSEPYFNMGLLFYITTTRRGSTHFCVCPSSSSSSSSSHGATVPSDTKHDAQTHRSLHTTVLGDGDHSVRELSHGMLTIARSLSPQLSLSPLWAHLLCISVFRVKMTVLMHRYT